jgi:hypothetical protein
MQVPVEEVPRLVQDLPAVLQVGHVAGADPGTKDRDEPGVRRLLHRRLRPRVRDQRVGGAVEEQRRCAVGPGVVRIDAPESDWTACTAEENRWWSPGPGWAALYPTFNAVIAPADEPPIAMRVGSIRNLVARERRKRTAVCASCIAWMIPMTHDSPGFPTHPSGASR